MTKTKKILLATTLLTLSFTIGYLHGPNHNTITDLLHAILPAISGIAGFAIGYTLTKNN